MLVAMALQPFCCPWASPCHQLTGLRLFASGPLQRLQSGGTAGRIAAASSWTPSACVPAVGEVLELECSGLASDAGRGVCKLEGGFVVFCERALPGERVRARATNVRSRHALAVKLTTLRPSPDEVAPRCEHFGECGGCSLQNLAYAAQLREKELQARLQTSPSNKFAGPPGA